MQMITPDLRRVIGHSLFDPYRCQPNNKAPYLGNFFVMDLFDKQPSFESGFVVSGSLRDYQINIDISIPQKILNR